MPFKKKDYEAWRFLGIGNKPDSVLACELTVSVDKVRYARKRLGLPSFGSRLLTQEGYSCRSLPEAKMDAVLHWKKIEHEHEVPILGKYRADFVLLSSNGSRKILEVIGMSGCWNYNRRLKDKHAAYDKAALEVEYVVSKEVDRRFTDCPLHLKSRRNGFVCRKCGKENIDLVDGLCRRICWHEEWVQRKPPKVCEQCGRKFHSGGTAKFCSREHYWKSLEHENPSKMALRAREVRRRVRYGLPKLEDKRNASALSRNVSAIERMIVLRVSGVKLVAIAKRFKISSAQACTLIKRHISAKA